MSSPLRLAGLLAAVGGLLMLGWTAIKASFDLAEGDGIAWSLAWACIAIGGIVALASGNDALPLFPIGGVLGTVTGVVAAVAVAGTLPSWRRWVLLANAVAYALSGGGDNLVQEFTWLGTWVLLGLALWTATRRTSAIPVPAGHRFGERTPRRLPVWVGGSRRLKRAHDADVRCRVRSVRCAAGLAAAP